MKSEVDPSTAACDTFQLADVKNRKPEAGAISTAAVGRESWGEVVGAARITEPAAVLGRVETASPDPDPGPLLRPAASATRTTTPGRGGVSSVTCTVAVPVPSGIEDPGEETGVSLMEAGPRMPRL